MKFPEVSLRFLSHVPIDAGTDVPADSGNPFEWTRYIRTTDISSLTALDQAKRVTVPEEVARLAPVQRDDILMTRAGSIGTTYIHESDEPAAYAGYLVRWRVDKSKVWPKYMAYWTQSRHFQGQVATGVVRSTIDNYSASKYRSTRAPVPALDEQRRIADFLDAETAQIDTLIAEQERFIELLRERRIAVILRAVTKGLNSSAPLVATGIDWLGSVPAHWQVNRLKISVESSVAGVWGEDAKGDKHDVLCARVADFDRPRLRVGDVPTVRSVKPADLAARGLRAGDLLLEKSGGTAINPVGFVAYFEGSDQSVVCSNFVARLRVASGQDPRYWLYAHAASYSTKLTARSLNQTTGIQNLDQRAYFDEKFPFPPAEEQKAIVRHIDEQTDCIDALVEVAEHNITLSKERRAALITAAVTGQIDVSTGRAA